jgi:hypothetical protein
MEGRMTNDTDLLRRTTHAVATFHTFRDQLDLALAEAGDTHSVDDVLWRVLTGDVFLTTSEHAFMILEVKDFPNARHLHIWLGGALPGHLKELHGLQERVETYANDLKVDAVTVAGRSGWSKLGLEHGFKAVNTMLYKGMNSGRQH